MLGQGWDVLMIYVCKCIQSLPFLLERISDRINTLLAQVRYESNEAAWLVCYTSHLDADAIVIPKRQHAMFHMLSNVCLIKRVCLNFQVEQSFC